MQNVLVGLAFDGLTPCLADFHHSDSNTYQGIPAVYIIPLYIWGIIKPERLRHDRIFPVSALDNGIYPISAIIMPVAGNCFKKNFSQRDLEGKLVISGREVKRMVCFG